MPDLEMKVTSTPIRKDERAGVLLYEIRIGAKITGYQIVDFKHGERMDFEADQRTEVLKTYEQMRQRKV